MKNFTFTFTRETSALGSKQLSCYWRQLLILSLFIATTVLTGFKLSAQNLPGIAPVQTPIGGFGVDGDAYANTPTPAYLNVGDWFYDSTLYPGTGRGLFTGGSVTDPTRTFFLQDNWLQNTDLTIFTGRNKINDHPNTYTWGPGSSPNKNEIQNAAAHFTYGAPGLGGSATDLWCLFAGDRMVTNGSSYIDFEFLQKSLTMTGTTSGGFTSAGINGGRTIGDVLVTIEFVQGGGAASVVIRKWQAVGTGYEYVVQANSLFVGKIFMTNNTAVTTVPFDAYGGNTYEVNQWAEGAINLTQVLGVGLDPCYSISTLFVRTRSSGSSDQSELKDFPGAPIQLDLGLIPPAPSVTTGERCGPGAVSFNATGCNQAGSVLKWYASATSLTPLYTGNPYNVEITTTTSFWVSCTNAAGCEGPRTQITRTVNPIPVLVVTNPAGTCAPSTVDLTAAAITAGSTLYGGTLSYWTDAAATVPLANPNAVTASGIYYIKAVTTPGCVDIKPVTVTVNSIVPGVIAGSQTLCAPFDPVAFTSTTPGSGGGTITYQWQMSTTSASAGFANIGGATLATYDAGAVSVPTWFRRVATSTLNTVPCADNSNVMMVSPNAIVPGVIAGDQTLCAPFDPVAFTSTTPGSGGGTITYQWQMSTTSASAGFANIGGATLATYDAGVVAVPTWFRRVATSTLNDVPCADDSNVLVVTPNDLVPGSIVGEQTICEGDDPAAFTSVGATGSGIIAYQWQSSTDGIAFTNIAGATNATYDAGILNASLWYKRLATSTLNDVVCEEASNIIKVTTEPCYEPLCSYTQGYYGNPTGNSCDGENTFTTYDLIDKALDYYPGDEMRIGLVGNSILIAKSTEDINKVIEYLPGGKAIGELVTGNPYISENDFKSWYTTTVGKNTTINNKLLAQTIVLGLNIGMHNNLGDFALQAGTFATAELDGGCGSTIAKERYCDTNTGIAYNEYKYYTIKGTVAGAASNVNELFALANRALGNADTVLGSEDGVSLADIHTAVDRINNAFDKCRMFIGWGIEPLPCTISATPTILAKVAVVEEPALIDSSVDFKVYPVPFGDVINVQYRFEYDTDVTIQVFNLQGGLIYGVVDNRYNKSEMATKQINLARTFDQALIIRLTTNKEKLNKTIVAKSSTQR